VIRVQPELSMLEQLLEAGRARAVLDFAGDGGIAGELEAEVVRQACRQAAEGRLDPFGINVAHARVSGSLDLRAFTIPCPLRFYGCSFTDLVRIDGASLKSVVAGGRPVPG
jgi:hypothetical protein